ncbi:DHA2 family efflux MFS transporter permease subunit [Actinomadura logoneensis]|uniref:DHA2 family efflux MFS transporter permease subunit n=1 Tax=Actinomadura logoneensis TaxID=2293572 RepID=A0A372JJ52_9ACTN|nr:MFS transporter [Actinomadura logoneensis]RFU40047.1 DHA2 family efflux MFS transporter permease subunit [Actinomadura logoneensis]
MSHPERPVAPDAEPSPPSDPRRWWGLGVIALAQLIVVLDMTIVNIALPSAQRDLGLTDGNRQWAVTAYTLAFGGLLLLGGRLGDLFGRKRSFIVGLIGFAGASALGGAATGPGTLFAARALQGVFAALLAPAALSLMTTTFTDPRERGKAFGVFGAIAGAGSAIGMLLGGLLTEYLDWRWCLYVNVPVAALAVAGAVVLLKDPGRRTGAQLDVLGAVLGSAGVLSIVYGFSEAESRDWSDPLVLALLAGGPVLLGLFALWQTRARTPLLPLHVVRDRQRAGAYLTMALITIAMFGVFLFLTYYLQGIKGWSPLRTGVAYLPMTVSMVVGSTQISARLLHRVPPRVLIMPGLTLAAGGLAFLASMDVDATYLGHVLPGICMMGLGMGATFMAAISTATARVAPHEQGAASATLNTMQQVGGSVGTALLNTIAASATTGWLTDHRIDLSQRTPQVKAALAEATVHGFSVATWTSGGILLLAAAVAGVFLNAKAPARKTAAPDDEAVPTPVHAA